jgi:outer membrane usher protein
MVQRNLPSGSGYGYRLQTRNAQSTQGTLSLQNDVGTYTLDVLQDHSTTATQISASGGLAWLEGHVFASRRIDQSFAVATVAGYPNVQVLADNQPAGHTDANGNALIPRLRAYDVNVISVDQRDLPMDAEIDALSVNATPYFRSGAAVTFPIKHAHAATFTVVLDDGGALPTGAVLTIAGKSSSALLGTNGEVYTGDLQASNALRAQWHGQQCEFVVPYAPGDDPLPDLGTFVCKGVRR